MNSSCSLLFHTGFNESFGKSSFISVLLMIDKHRYNETEGVTKDGSEEI
jgi:hypothetical protein